LFPFLLRKTKLGARKQGRYAQKASAGKEFQPEVQSFFRRTRRADRAPLQPNHSVLAERTACPPGPRNDPCLMVFAHNPPMADFRAGQCLKFNRAYAHFRKVKVGKKGLPTFTLEKSLFCDPVARSEGSRGRKTCSTFPDGP
jgi:hypothetical protein